MWKWTDNRCVELVCRLLVGGVFVYASFDKILHPTEFAMVVYNYQILPLPLSNLLAMSLPWLELFTGLALIIGTWRAEASFLLGSLLVVFIVALTVNVYRGVDIDCGCLTLSGGGRGISLVTIAQDVVLLAAAVVVFLRAKAELESAAE
jgi:uncharacterized membrane protein YphA (DoxX/SURF4 family)